MPALVRPEDGDQRDAEVDEQGRRRMRGHGDAKQAGVAACDQQAKDESDSNELADGADVLHCSRHAYADEVHNGEEEDGHDRQSLEFKGGERHDLRGVERESGSQRGDAARLDEAQERPSVKECQRLSINVPQVNVETARPWIIRCQFSDGEAAEQAQDSAGNPHQQYQRERGQLLGNGARYKEDSGSDDRADNDGNSIADTEHAHERRLRRTLGWTGEWRVSRHGLRLDFEDSIKCCIALLRGRCELVSMLD